MEGWILFGILVLAWALTPYPSSRNMTETTRRLRMPPPPRL